MIEHIDSGEAVACDFCGEDFSESEATGGLLFQSKAACPECAPRIEAGAKSYGETHFIRGRCPEGMQFRAWVREILRGGAPATIKIITGHEAEAVLNIRLNQPNPENQ